MAVESVGNQLPILLIDFQLYRGLETVRWESVTDPLDRLRRRLEDRQGPLGISYRSS